MELVDIWRIIDSIEPYILKRHYEDVLEILEYNLSNLPKQSDKEVEIKEIALDYLGIDWWHHKQYALEKIIKVICPERTNEDYEKWIPA